MSGDALEARRLTARGVLARALARALARGMALATPVALIVWIAASLNAVVDGRPPTAALAEAIVAGVAVGAPPFACGVVELALPRGGTRGDVVAALLCVVLGTLACLGGVWNVQHAVDVLQGRAGVLEHAPDVAVARSGTLPAAGYSALLAVMAFGRRRGWGPQGLVLGTTAAALTGAGLLALFARRAPGLGTAVCTALFLGLALNMLVDGADLAVDLLEHRARARRPFSS